MKKKYVQPELNILEFDVMDIITLSFATGDGDASTPFDSEWIPEGGGGGRDPFRP